jgi:hypothetical protein
MDTVIYITSHHVRWWSRRVLPGRKPARSRGTPALWFARHGAADSVHHRCGSHLAMYDDQEAYFAGLTGFLTSLPPTGT